MCHHTYASHTTTFFRFLHGSAWSSCHFHADVCTGQPLYAWTKGYTGVGGMAVPLEKVSPRTFMPRHDCPPGHWCLGMNVPSIGIIVPPCRTFFPRLSCPPPPPPPPPPVGCSPTFAHWVSSLYLDLYPSDSVCGLYYYHIQPNTLLDAWVQIQVYPTFRQNAKVRSGYAQLAPPPRFLVYHKSSTKHLAFESS